MNKTLLLSLTAVFLMPLGARAQTKVVAAAAVTFPAPLPAPAAGEPTHSERDGVVMIEAESGSGAWERFEEAGATVIRSVVGEHMTYRVRFNEPGVRYVHLRCRPTVGFVDAKGNVLEDTSTNDVHVTVGGERLYGSDNVTRPDGIRSHGKGLSWWSLPKGPGGHTPQNIKQKGVMTYLPQAGVYEVVLGYRSPAFVVDKIAFTVSPKAPEDLPVAP